MVSGRSLAASPDGKSLFYLKSDSRAIFRTEKSGLSEEQVYSFDNPPMRPFSVLPFPDGDNLLVESVAESNYGQTHFHKVNLSSHKAVDLGTVSGYPGWAVWAEPGKTLLFRRTVNGLTNIWKYSLADQALTQITFGPGSDYSPMPDAARKGMYFVNGKSSGFLTVYRARSKQSVDIVSGNASWPVISPDGRHVMYIKMLGRDKSELWVSDVDGASQIKLARGSGWLGTGDWSPDRLSTHLCGFFGQDVTPSAPMDATFAKSGGWKEPPDRSSGPQMGGPFTSAASRAEETQPSGKRMPTVRTSRNSWTAAALLLTPL